MGIASSAQGVNKRNLTMKMKSKSKHVPYKIYTKENQIGQYLDGLITSTKLNVSMV